MPTAWNSLLIYHRYQCACGHRPTAVYKYSDYFLFIANEKYRKIILATILVQYQQNHTDERADSL